MVVLRVDPIYLALAETNVDLVVEVLRGASELEGELWPINILTNGAVDPNHPLFRMNELTVSTVMVDPSREGSFTEAVFYREAATDLKTFYDVYVGTNFPRTIVTREDYIEIKNDDRFVLIPVVCGDPLIEMCVGSEASFAAKRAGERVEGVDWTCEGAAAGSDQQFPHRIKSDWSSQVTGSVVITAEDPQTGATDSHTLAVVMPSDCTTEADGQGVRQFDRNGNAVAGASFFIKAGAETTYFGGPYTLTESFPDGIRVENWPDRAGDPPSYASGFTWGLDDNGRTTTRDFMFTAEEILQDLANAGITTGYQVTVVGEQLLHLGMVNQNERHLVHRHTMKKTISYNGIDAGLFPDGSRVDRFQLTCIHNGVTVTGTVSIGFNP